MARKDDIHWSCLVLNYSTSSTSSWLPLLDTHTRTIFDFHETNEREKKMRYLVSLLVCVFSTYSRQSNHLRASWIGHCFVCHPIRFEQTTQTTATAAAPVMNRCVYISWWLRFYAVWMSIGDWAKLCRAVAKCWSFFSSSLAWIYLEANAIRIEREQMTELTRSLVMHMGIRVDSIWLWHGVGTRN